MKKTYGIRFQCLCGIDRVVRFCGLLAQVVMSFHRCGGNVGDSVDIPIPDWVVKAKEKHGGLFYQDQYGNVDTECLSLGADEEPVFDNYYDPISGATGIAGSSNTSDKLNGRTGVQLYKDFMRAFRNTFKSMIKAG